MTVLTFQTLQNCQTLSNQHSGYAIFIDDIVDTVRHTNVGCYVNLICCAIFLYADDIVLLAPSVTGLQFLLTACERYLSETDMNINVSKSTCIRFGPRFSRPNMCEKLRLCNGDQLDYGVCAVNIWVYILLAQLPLEYRLISLRVVFFVHVMLFLVVLGE